MSFRVNSKYKTMVRAWDMIQLGCFPLARMTKFTEVNGYEFFLAIFKEKYLDPRRVQFREQLFERVAILKCQTHSKTNVSKKEIATSVIVFTHNFVYATICRFILAFSFAAFFSL